MPINLTISPAQTELIAKPGASLTQAYTITNNSPTSVALTTEVLPWTPTGTDGSVSYNNVSPNPNLQFSLNNADLSLGQKFILHPGEKRQLVLKVKSTNDTNNTDAYYTFFVSQDLSNSFNPDLTQSAATARLGSHLLISFSQSENIPPSFSISDFAATPFFKDTFWNPLTFRALIHNDTAHYQKPTGTLTITKDGLTQKQFDIFPHNVLAGNSRDLLCNSNNEPVPCVISPPFWPGKYTATLKIDNGGATFDVASITFFVVPYTLFFAFGLLGLISYILITRRRVSPP